MKIILYNQMELSPLVVIGERRYVQRESRDALTFVFQATVGLEELDELFTAVNCESITIMTDDGESYIYKGYTIRAELLLRPVELQPATDTTEAVYEDRIFVTMAERTVMESQVAEANAALNALAFGEE